MANSQGKKEEIALAVIFYIHRCRKGNNNTCYNPWKRNYVSGIQSHVRTQLTTVFACALEPQEARSYGYR